MVNSQYIFLILMALVLITVFNLYYKSHARLKLSTLSAETYREWTGSDAITRSACPLTGFKCPTDELCDCQAFCVNSSELVPFRVLPSDQRIYILNEKLKPGTYCLPRGIGECPQKTSHHIFSLSGWSCIPRNRTVFTGHRDHVCKHEDAKDNDLNVLWDQVLQEPADLEKIEDYYETMPGTDGQSRYRCRCDSRSVDGTPMISVFPLTCHVDYCVQDLEDLHPGIGWNGKECVCGVYEHANPNDKTSPCVAERTRIENNQWIARVDCMKETSFMRRNLACPSDERVLNAEEMTFLEGKNTEDFLDYVLQHSPSP